MGLCTGRESSLLSVPFPRLLSPQPSWYSAGAGRGLGWMCLCPAVTVTVQIGLLWL